MTPALACYMWPDCHCMSGPCPNLPAQARPHPAPDASEVSPAAALRLLREIEPLLEGPEALPHGYARAMAHRLESWLAPIARRATP